MMTLTLHAQIQQLQKTLTEIDARLFNLELRLPHKEHCPASIEQSAQFAELIALRQAKLHIQPHLESLRHTEERLQRIEADYNYRVAEEVLWVPPLSFKTFDRIGIFSSCLGLFFFLSIFYYTIAGGLLQVTCAIAGFLFCTLWYLYVINRMYHWWGICPNLFRKTPNPLGY